MKVPKAKQLPSGNWFIHLRLGGENIPVTAATEKECTLQAQTIKAQYLLGARQSRKDGVTLSQAIDQYIRRRTKGNAPLSPSTVDGYRRVQKNHFASVIGKPIFKIKDWQDAIDDDLETYSPKTVQNAWGLIKSVLREQKIPDPEVSLPKVKSNERGWLDPDQILRLVEASDGTPAALPVFLGLHSLRRSEIAALSWRDINLTSGEFGVIRIHSAVVQDENHRFVERNQNKTEGSTRSVPIMIPELAVILASTPMEQRVGKVVQCSPHTICNRINAACEAAQLPKVGTHGLRHSFASLGYHLQPRISELMIMEMGGWSTIDTVHRIYTHLAKEDRIRAQNEMMTFYTKTQTKNANES